MADITQGGTSNSLRERLVYLADMFRTSMGLSNRLSLDDMFIILSTNNLSSLSGVNIINGSDPSYNFHPDAIDEYTFSLASGGNGKGSFIDLDPKQFKAKHGFRIYGNTQWTRDFNQRPVFYKDSKYTFSVWARLTPGTTSTKGYCYIRSWSTKQDAEILSSTDYSFVPTNEWKKYTITFDTSQWNKDETSSFAFGVSGLMNADFAEPMLEVGETAHEWQPSPYDLFYHQANLLIGTSDQYKELTGTGWLGVTTANSAIIPASLGETFTYTADIKNVKGSSVDAQIYERDSSGHRYYRGSSSRISVGEEKEVSVTETMEHKDCKYIEVSIWGEADNPGSVLQVKNERLYRGAEPGIWTPNPADKARGGGSN